MSSSEMADQQFFSEPFSPLSDIDLLQLQAISDQQSHQNATDTTSEMADLQFFSEPFSSLLDIDLLQLQAISDQQSHQNATDTTSEMADLQFFSEPFSPFSDIDLLQLQAISDQQSHQNATDHNSPSLLSSSPPSYQLETLSLYQQTQLHQTEQNCPNLPIGWPNLSLFDAQEVKTEEFHQVLEPHSYGGAENVARFIQRSYSSKCFDGNNNKPGFYFQPSFDSLMESPSFQNQALSLSSPESSFLPGQMRRVSSTGDLQNLRTNRAPRESSVMEEAAANFKTGRYSAEERKERISKYRGKRSQRNFNKTIKYACRKTLADKRPRIRGRFARNEETGEILKAACSSTREEDGDKLWVEGFNVEEEEMNATVRGGGGGGQFMSNFGATQFQYYGF